MRITVVGAGFSGLLTTLHLLRHPGAEVTLIEKGPQFGTGAAYSTHNPDHLLNVRLNNMSAFPDEPDHLQVWLEQSGQPRRPDEFITRGLYGEYLRTLLTDLRDSEAGPRLRLLRGEVTDLTREAEWRASVAGHGEIRSDAVVLALGNIEPHTPALFSRLSGSAQYVGDPWRAVNLPASARSILLIGTGLTMVDTALALRGAGRSLVALSRRGLLPRPHAASSIPPEAAAYQGGPSRLLRAVRARARASDWRGVMDELRPHARRLWRSWSSKQREQALRHLRPYWDVHRHRLAPAVAARIQLMQDSGELTLSAGRIVEVAPYNGKVRVTWRPRRGAESRTLTVDAVVNCTGPLSDIRHTELPVLKNLIRRGVVVSDPQGLGAQVTDDHRLLNEDGVPNEDLFAVGPLTRGAFWEITAVPDIRIQAAEVASALLQSTKLRP